MEEFSTLTIKNQWRMLCKKYYDGIIQREMTLREIPKELKNCYLASADGLTHRGDGIHFNSASYRIFGERYFEAYLKGVSNESNNI